MGYLHRGTTRRRAKQLFRNEPDPIVTLADRAGVPLVLVQDWLSGGFLSLEATDAIRACLARRGRSQAEKAPVPEERLTPPPERLTPRLTVETVFDFPLDLDTVKLLGYSRDPFTVALVTPRGHVENFTKPALHKRFAPFIVSRIERTIASLGRV